MSEPWLASIFWASVAVLAYAYVAYPLAIGAAARRRPLWRQSAAEAPRSASILIAARDEEANIGPRLEELTQVLVQTGGTGEILVGSDGSTDRTAEVAEQFAPRGVRVVTWSSGRGKAAMLSALAREARGEILVMADARQRWAPDALVRLLENFADPAVGAVSGELRLESQGGVLAGVGLYWRFETWLRKQESRLHSQVGVTGAIAAVRRELFRPVPEGVILDDVYWPLQVVLQGRRVVHDERATAFDRLPDSAAGEMRRKIRTLAGNFQLIAVAPELLLPWRNPAWSVLVSHKLLRLAAPWAMLGALATSALLGGPWYGAAFGLQAALLVVAVVGLTPWGARNRVCAAAGSFLMLHAAAWAAFWVWATGRSGRLWRPVSATAASRDGDSAA
ncbi:MAG: glycosyltransferase family 2 protein [Pirellulales bacterium]|nr:glycosyltransferase family 2 protein [Pirellulales bacterium]